MDQHKLDFKYENMPQEFATESLNDSNKFLESAEMTSHSGDTACPFPNGSNIWNSESPPYLQMDIPSSRTNSEECLRSTQQLEAKVDMVYSLLAILGDQEHADMGKTLLSLSTNPDNCLAMRQSGCLPLLVQLVQSDRNRETRKKAAEALHNIVHSQPDEKLRKRESRILKILETLSVYSHALENSTFERDENTERHPLQIVSQMMTYSFDEGYRQAICQLGGIHSIVKMIEAEHLHHESITEDVNCNLMRRYACMVLTNLTFGDSGNKALLCSYKDFIKGLVEQLKSPNDELRQVTASIFRNLSWRSDSTSQEILKDVGTCRGLMKAAMLPNKETTLISILSALWNLSAHSTQNKSEICSVKGALAFLVRMLTEPSTQIVENSGGVLRNVSSTISTREDYRIILRQNNCFEILIEHLNSSNLTIVSNACGILWNLSSQNATDQELLRTLGAATPLKCLSDSKHKVISMGSAATLKNLTTSAPTPEEEKDDEPFAIYAETDLDQPTDYSLRYAEDSTTDSDDDETRRDVVKTAPEYVVGVDTIETYCTEGTPYETPFNFSTSTSMSDLNDKNDVEKKRKIDGVVSVNKPPDFPTVRKSVNEPTTASLNGVGVAAAKPKSSFSSGLISPEKPMNYCEEGTPGYFSRVSSFGSLNSSPVCASSSGVVEKEASEKLLVRHDDVAAPKETTVEAKVVKFENNINYCEETPLMFSRSSSLGSVDSIEHSIQDDRSSVISDFSRLTSGIISPSELPDSPTQTVPPSPKPQKNHEFPTHHRNGGSGGRPASRRSLPKTSVFEDKLMKFKEESTPTQYSIATSLSSLTIDDQDENNQDNAIKQRFEKKNDAKAVGEDPKLENYGDVNGNELNRRLAQPSSSNTTTKMNVPNSVVVANPEVHVSPLMVRNTLRTYCTEDTPAVLSHNSSISDLSLSTLSMVDKEPLMNRVYLSENSSETSDGVKLIDETSHGASLGVQKEKSDVATFMTSYDEVTSFAVEDSPMEFSLRSSLSNLTFESGKDFTPKSPMSPQLLEPSIGPTETISSPQKEENENLDESTNRVEEMDQVEEIKNEIDENCVDNEQNGECTEDIQMLGVNNGSLKSRKWKWKWKFSTENSSKDISPHNEGSNNDSSDIDTLTTTNSLDLTYKKKKWWKWKFGSKDSEQSNEEEVDSKNSTEENPFEKNDNSTFNRTESSRNRKKSKKWKWKWKFTSKDDDKAEKSLPDGVIKSKYSESFREPSNRKSRINVTTSPTKLSRSVSEPRKRAQDREISARTSTKILSLHSSNQEAGQDVLGGTAVGASSGNTQLMNELNNDTTKATVNSVIDDKKQEKTDQGKCFVEQCIQFGMQKEVEQKIQAQNVSKSEDTLRNRGLDDEEPSTNQSKLTEESIMIDQQSEKSNDSNAVSVKSPNIKVFPKSEKQPEISSGKDVLKLCTEEPLDPVTISIIKRVLQRRFSKGDDVDKILNDIDMKVTEFSPEDCNFEIVLEERIKVTLAKNGETAAETESLRCKKSHVKPTQQSNVHLNKNNFDVALLEYGKNKRIGCGEENIKQIKNQDYSSLIEECIQLGINKKNENRDEEAIYANVSMSPGYSRSMTRRNSKEISTNSLPVRNNVKASHETTNSLNTTPIAKRSEHPNMITIGKFDQERLKTMKNPDYAALLEECIQLGMPKKKDAMLKESEVRSSLPNIDASPSFPRNRTVDCSTNVENKKNYMALVEECIQFGMPKKKGESEEAIYANISSARYNNSGAIKKLKETTSKSTSCLPEKSAVVNVDFGINKSAMDKTNYYSLNNKKSDVTDRKLENEMLIQECIQLGMPRKKETPDEIIYTNTTQSSTIKSKAVSGIPRFSLKKMTRSDSEPNPSKINSVPFTDNRKGASSITINRTALEDCIQLGWPKRKDSIISTDNSIDSAPKNVDVASVARNIQESRRVWYKMTATGAGDELENRYVANKTERSGITETFLTGLRRNGYN